MNVPPTHHSYGETWSGRGIPLDQIPDFIERARAAGAPPHAQLHTEHVPSDVMSGLPIGGTRAYFKWRHQQPKPDPKQQQYEPEQPTRPEPEPEPEPEEGEA